MNILQQLEEEAATGTCTVPRFCALASLLFGVRPHEVAVLSLRHAMLQFIYPAELRELGMIPLMSSALAAKTASSRTAEIFNNFTHVRHNSIFETVKIEGASEKTIQKLMSAPLMDRHGEVIGVMQISRKGSTPDEAGNDFTAADLKMLQDVAKIFGRSARNLMERTLEPATF